MSPFLSCWHQPDVIVYSGQQRAPEDVFLPQHPEGCQQKLYLQIQDAVCAPLGKARFSARARLPNQPRNKTDTKGHRFLCFLVCIVLPSKGVTGIGLLLSSMHYVATIPSRPLPWGSAVVYYSLISPLFWVSH